MNDFAIHFHFKNAAPAWDQGQILDALAKGAQQLARQTDGLWGVVSHHAKRNCNVHGLSCLIDAWVMILQKGLRLFHYR